MKKLTFIIAMAIFGLTACQQQVVTPLPKSETGEVKVTVTDGAEMAHGMMPEIKSDQDFLKMMIPHHQEAIDNSKWLLARTGDVELKKFLAGVVEVQSKEVEQMKTWYKEWFGSDYQADNRYMAMMVDMSKLSGVEADQAYIKGMIDHHQGAIEMAKQLQTFTKRPELIKLANDVVTVQSAEITMLKGWVR